MYYGNCNFWMDLSTWYWPVCQALQDNCKSNLAICAAALQTRLHSTINTADSRLSILQFSLWSFDQNWLKIEKEAKLCTNMFISAFAISNISLLILLSFSGRDGENEMWRHDEFLRMFNYSPMMSFLSCRNKICQHLHRLCHTFLWRYYERAILWNLAGIVHSVHLIIVSPKKKREK